MIQRRNRLPFELALTSLLALSSLALSTEGEIKASDNPADLPPRYRYAMNGSQLMPGIHSVQLAPLSASLWDITPGEFSNFELTGRLRDLNASQGQALPRFTIPYISCDTGDTLNTIGDAFNETGDWNVSSAILYSARQDHCVVSPRLMLAEWLKLFTVINSRQAQDVARLEFDADSKDMVHIHSDSDSLSPAADPDHRGQRSSSPIPMIVLYSLTSLITTLLLFVIIGGAIKARRHPERYGPRAVLRPRQSRAKGIAMAMLETLPIVKFGDPDSKQRHPGQERLSVELADATKTLDAKPEGVGSKPSLTNVVEQEAPTTSAQSLPEGAQQDAAGGITTLNVPEPSSDGQKSTLDQPSRGHVDDSLSCSICTEDFTLGEETRVLPCNHRFHPPCVDPWLLNVSGTCPLCRIDLRPPQEVAEGGDEASVSIPPRRFLSIPTRPRSMVSGMRRGARGLDLQAILGASRDERIGILRRWRDELRQRETNVQDGSNESTEGPRRSVRLSQRLRDGFAERSSSVLHPGPNALAIRTSTTARPFTWFGHDQNANAANEEAHERTTVRNETSIREGRATTWYGDGRPAQEVSASSLRNPDEATRPAAAR